MLLLHNQPTSTESVIIGSGHTTRFAHVKGCPYKTDNTEDIGPNIVPVSVFVRMGEGQGWMSGGEAVRKRRGGRGATPTLTNVSRPVRGSFGYQGALGAHSVGFCSWAHWPPELSLSRHNELLMTLWVTGRERASTHTAQWRTYASAPCLMSACIHTLADTHTHSTNTQSHIQMYSDKKCCRRRVLGEKNQQAACIHTACYSNVLFVHFIFNSGKQNQKISRLSGIIMENLNIASESLCGRTTPTGILNISR